MATITDAARTDLHNKVRDVLGEREGDTLMEHLPPVGWADVATKADLEMLRLSTRADLDRGFRRQAMWVVSLFVFQQATFVYMVERLAP